MFKPMLAGKLPANGNLEGVGLRLPILGSRKLDGVRACVQHGKLVSRNLKLIPNLYVQRLFGRAELEGLDGELILGDPRDADTVFRRTSSAVMRHEGGPPVAFYVFDMFDDRFAFKQRLQHAEQYMKKLRRALPCVPFVSGNSKLVQSCLQLVEHVELSTKFEISNFEGAAVAEGYEGVMLRDPFGPYKQGRSTLREGYLLKLKRFLDGEAVVIGAEELLHNDNVCTIDALGRSKRSAHKAGMRATGTLGALVVRDCKTKIKFNIGTGFSAKERIELWKEYLADGPITIVGKRIVKYKYFPTGGKDRPRHPVFKGFRDRRDI